MSQGCFSLIGRNCRTCRRVSPQTSSKIESTFDFIFLSRLHFEGPYCTSTSGVSLIQSQSLQILSGSLIAFPALIVESKRVTTMANKKKSKAQSAVMQANATPTTEHTFPFLQLPRELRDKVLRPLESFHPLPAC